MPDAPMPSPVATLAPGRGPRHHGRRDRRLLAVGASQRHRVTVPGAPIGRLLTGLVSHDRSRRISESFGVPGRDANALRVPADVARSGRGNDAGPAARAVDDGVGASDRLQPVALPSLDRCRRQRLRHETRGADRRGGRRSHGRRRMLADRRGVAQRVRRPCPDRCKPAADRSTMSSRWQRHGTREHGPGARIAGCASQTTSTCPGL